MKSNKKYIYFLVMLAPTADNQLAMFLMIKVRTRWFGGNQVEFNEEIS